MDENRETPQQHRGKATSKGRGSARNNVFLTRFLERLDQERSPSHTFAGLGSGPWSVHRDEDGLWGCYAVGDPLPWVLVRERPLALLFAAVLPAWSALPRLQLCSRDGRYVLLDNGTPMGTLRHHHPELVDQANILTSVQSWPLSFSYYVESTGAPLLERAGRILHERLRSQR